MTITILHGDCRQVLQTLPERSVQCVVTSPPYYGLRRYSDDPREIGQEATPDCLAWARKEQPCGACYVCAMREVFGGLWRVLRDDGVVFLNIGDSYAGGKQGRADADTIRAIDAASGRRPNAMDYGDNDRGGVQQRPVPPGFKQKDLLGIPWRVALALQADGWYLRSAITWCKGNPMPESVQDRPTKASEMLFMLSKQARYFYDIDATRVLANRLNRSGGVDEARLEVTRPASGGFAAQRGQIALNHQWAPYLILATLLTAKRVFVKERHDLLGKCFDILKDPRRARVGLSALAMAMKPTSDVLANVVEHLGIVIAQCDAQAEAELWISLLSGARTMKRNDGSFAIKEAREVIAKVITNAQILRHSIPLDALTKSSININTIEDAVSLLDSIDLDAGLSGDGLITESLIQQIDLALCDIGFEESSGPSHDVAPLMLDLHQSNYTTKEQTSQGRNLWDWWIVNTRPYAGAHYATMPEALIEPCVLAGSSAQACEHCGAAWVRVVERETIAKDKQTGRGWVEGIATQDNWESGTPTHSGLSNDHYRRAITTGFAPSCACPDNTGSAASVVLDPFGGSGTVGRVALRLQRRAILIELNGNYIDQHIEKRTNNLQVEMQL